MTNTQHLSIGQRIAALADADLTTRPAEVWAVALEAERAGVAVGVVDALLDPSSPAVVRERALAVIGARLVIAAAEPATEIEVRRAMAAAGV